MVFDPISPTNHNDLWHRGFPLQLIRGKNKIIKKRGTITPHVQADFWDEDPDVDAVQRLITNTKTKFSKTFSIFF